MPPLTSLRFSLDNNPKLKYLPALDGLRALAVLAVMLYHFESKSFFPGGGLVGVDLFFVLSGFLITTLLLQEWARFGDISLKRFYQRRVLRLLPAVAVMLLVYVAVNIALHDSEFTGQQPGELVIKNSLLVAAYCFNWLLVSHGNYGEGFGHLWSLSVEEQFYMIWPFVLLVFLRLKTPAATLLAISLGFFTISALLPLLLDGDRSRFYYATDYRLHTLLMGSVLAQLYVSGVLRQAITRLPLYRLGLVVAGSLLLAIPVLVSDRSAFLFVGGHTAVAICSGTVVIACMFQQRTALTSLLSHPLLVYIGQRSYALYLWHYPISFWLRSLDPVPQVLAAFLISFLAAELSYRLVEGPALRLKSRIAKAQAQTQQPLPASGPETSPSAAA